MQRGRQRAGVDQLERVVRPRRSSSPSARRTATATARASNPTIVTGQRPRARGPSVTALGEPARRARPGGSPSSADDSTVERLVGLEEEVAADAHAAQQPVHHVEVDRDELAAGDLVLTVHAAEPRRTAVSRARARPAARGPGPSPTATRRVAQGGQRRVSVARRRAPPPSTRRWCCRRACAPGSRARSSPRRTCGRPAGRSTGRRPAPRSPARRSRSAPSTPGVDLAVRRAGVDGGDQLTERLARRGRGRAAGRPPARKYIASLPQHAARRTTRAAWRRRCTASVHVGGLDRRCPPAGPTAAGRT